MDHIKKYHKIVLIGPEAVGKTCLFERFKTSRFNELQTTTIGASFSSHTTTTNGDTVRLHVWDTAGQDRFNVILPMYIRGSSIVVLCLEKPDEYELNKYLEYYRHYNPESKLYFVFTKCDLIEDRILYKLFEDTIRKEGIEEVWYTSAKTGRGVSDLFESIAKRVVLIPIPDIYYEEIKQLSTQEEIETMTCSTCKN